MSASLANSLSFLSPVIVATGVLIFALFSASFLKGLFFLFWLLVATATRIAFLWMIGAPPLAATTNPVCTSGDFLPYDNTTYSTFALCFTFFYFTMPMYISDNVNYVVLTFFLSYIMFDIAIKLTNACYPSVASVLGEILAGGGLAALIVSLLYNSPIGNYLFTNEVNTNKEVCNMPTKQTFRCSVYKNGELVSSSLTS
jgi:hypothetical protein